MSEVNEKLVHPFFKGTAIKSLIIANIDGTVIFEKILEEKEGDLPSGIVSASVSSIQSISNILLAKLKKDSLESYILFKPETIYVAKKIQEFFLIAKVKRSPDTEVKKYLTLLADKGLPLVADISAKGASEAITAKVKQLVPEASTIALVSASGAPISYLSVENAFDNVIDFDEIASYSAAIGLAAKPMGALEGDSSISIGEKSTLVSVNLSNERILLILVPNGHRSIQEYLKLIAENIS
ncbi:MAG: hypothetical protein ACW967_01195 [Candidatus Hodarchaeales archaeon]|jgi:predicted regulator of Ras-like GTPase activity (Roadblock/LC7/MglB family)